jgi:hypothetical protein
MAVITWYVLSDLDQFLLDLNSYARNRDKPTYLIHLLATYPPGVQQYGRDRFFDLTGILNYFNLEYLEASIYSLNRKKVPQRMERILLLQFEDVVRGSNFPA